MEKFICVFEVQIWNLTDLNENFNNQIQQINKGKYWFHLVTKADKIQIIEYYSNNRIIDNIRL